MAQNGIDNQEDAKFLDLPLTIEENTIRVPIEFSETIHENGYFGSLLKNDILILDPEEALLLVERGRLRFLDEKNEEIIIQNLVNTFKECKPSFWSSYLVYKDLRNRGYVVKVGTQVTTPLRIYPRGTKPGESISKISIFPFAEGEQLDLDFLDQIVSQARINRKKLLLAVVDRLGDVTYYQSSQLELKYNDFEYEFRDELVDEK